MFNETQILHTSFLLSIVLSIIFLIVRIPIGLGLLLGGVMGCLAFKLLIIDATRLLQRAMVDLPSRKEVSHHNWRGFLKRSSLYALALTVAILSPYLNFFAAFAGLLLPRVAIIFLMLRGRMNRGT